MPGTDTHFPSCLSVDRNQPDKHDTIAPALFRCSFPRSACNTFRSYVRFGKPCGRSSVVERHVANVNVEGSTPFARLFALFLGDGAFYFRSLVSPKKRAAVKR